jgi:hypothetical protein
MPRRIGWGKPRRGAQPGRGTAEGPAISSDDYYGRPERPRRRARDDDRDDDYDRPYRRRGRYDVRRGQSDQDREHLRLLSIFHYILGGLFALFGCFPIIHVTLGLAMISGAMNGPQMNGPPPEIGWIFVVIGGGIMLVLWTLAGCLLFAGRCLAQQKAYMFCFVVACLACLNMPLGTLLGVFTLIVLSRPSVKELFEANRAGAGPDDRRDE